MVREENIQKELIDKFSYLQDKVIIKKARRLFAEIPLEIFEDVLSYSVKQMDFSFLCTITGLDDGDKFSFVYHLAHKNGIVLNLRISVPKEKPVIKTVTEYFPAADIYERELKNLFGVEIEDLPEGKRYPLPDDWPPNQFPLRKGWKKEMLTGEASKEQEVKQNG